MAPHTGYSCVGCGCNPIKDFRYGTDIGATTISVVGTVLGIVGLFTPLAPVAAATLIATTVAAGTYGAKRSTNALVDRTTHGQSINPFTNKDSFFCWLGLVGAIVSLGATTATSVVSSMAARGTHVGQFARIAATTAIFGSVGVNSVQQQRYDQMRPFLNADQQKAFNQLIEQNRAEAVASGNARTGEMHGGEKTIRTINRAFTENNLNPLIEKSAAACEIKAWQLYNAAEDNLAANPNMPDGQYLKEVNQGRDMMRIASDVRGEHMTSADTLKQQTAVKAQNSLNQKTPLQTLSAVKQSAPGQTPSSLNQISATVSQGLRAQEDQNIYNSVKFRSDQQQKKKQKIREQHDSNPDESDDEDCICRSVTIKVLYVNMCSVKPNKTHRAIPNKIQRLRNLILMHQPHIIAIVESWLNTDDDNEQILSYLNLAEYRVFRQDRGDGHHPGNAYGHTTTGLEDRRGGGILVLWKKPDDFNVDFNRQPAEDYADNAVNFDLDYKFQCAYCSNGQPVKKYGFTVAYRRPGPFADQGK
ncbi:unnamed protein product [Rotaria sp. Silwood1]|nr:unnamed protein product [Rotaria sp. Silwood1]